MWAWWVGISPSALARGSLSPPTLFSPACPALLPRIWRRPFLHPGGPGHPRCPAVRREKRGIRGMDGQPRSTGGGGLSLPHYPDNFCQPHSSPSWECAPSFGVGNQNCPAALTKWGRQLLPRTFPARTGAHTHGHAGTRTHAHTRACTRAPPTTLPLPSLRRAGTRARGGPCPWLRGDPRQPRSAAEAPAGDRPPAPAPPERGEPVTPPASRLLPHRSGRGP